MKKIHYRWFSLCLPLAVLLAMLTVSAGAGERSYRKFEINGETHYICSQCESENVVKHLQKPTCAQTGNVTLHCNDCGYDNDVSWVSDFQEEIQRLSHNYVNGVCTMCGQPQPNDGGSKESPVVYDANAEITTSDNIRREQYGHLYKLDNGKRIRKVFLENNWSCPIFSHLFQRGDGNYTRVEVITPPIKDEPGPMSIRYANIVVETYNTNFQLISAKVLPMELDIFGGFYAGNGYNFFFFGQKNNNSSDETEVIRVVKYSRDWERLGQASLYGANTRVPFDAGSLRCAEYDGMLYVRTSHLMYSGHQANLTFAVRESNMVISDSAYEVSNSGTGYVSHSFNQFIFVDNEGNLMALDHGDAHPRAAVLFRYNQKAGKEVFHDEGLLSVEMKKFDGQTGDNYTGATLGGVSESNTKYLVVGTITDINKAIENRQDVMVCTVDKDSFGKKEPKVTLLTNYQTDEPSYGAYPPHLVKISGNRFLVLWEVKEVTVYSENHSSSSDLNRVFYTFLDGDGNQIGEIRSADNAALSDCQPILANGRATWYVTDDSIPTFYSIDANTGEFSSVKASKASAASANSTGFQDVSASAYYADAVKWAVAQGVTNGVSATNFAPDDICSRGQVATFLWRANGCPEPTTAENPFVDVDPSSAFYKAILWAAENGITSGTSDTTFSPGNPCTRAHVVTFLWRSQGKPAVTGAAPLADSFPQGYYTDAVRWADSADLLNDTGEAFTPSALCPRADIVTYLYRVLNR